MRDWPMRRQLFLQISVLCGSGVLIAAASLLSLRAVDGDVTELTGVVGPANDVNSVILQTMTDAETGLRGYLATQNPLLLQPYNGTQARVRVDQARLHALLSDPRLSQENRSGYVTQEQNQNTAVDAWWNYATHALRLAATGRTADLVAADLVTGKAIFDRVRAANAALGSSLSSQRTELRGSAGRTLDVTVAIVVAGSVIAIILGFLMAGRASRAVTVPISRLQQVVQRQRAGDGAVHADEESGPTEVRDLAAAFNVLASHNAQLTTAQATALRLQEAAFDVGRAIRVTANAQEAMDVACARLGPALGARRMMVTTIDQEAPRISRRAQWHAPELPALPDLAADLEPHLVRLATELWSRGDHLVIDDIRAEEVQRQAWPPLFQRETGARALVLVPIGLGERAIGSIYVLTDEGPRPWSDSAVATIQQTATFLARAITQAEYENQRADYVTRLEHLDRQKTEFLSTVSHELRTPLTSIQGYLELILEDEALGGQQRHMLTVIERNAARLRGLIEDLLVLNRIESGSLIPNKSEVSLSILLSNTAEDLRPMADKAAVRLQVGTDGTEATVLGDHIHLQRALVNVVSNAIKFTPREGEVRLSCWVDPSAQQAVVTCRDTGIGIPKADREHLFTRFFRASNATSKAIPGTGLGLAIVQAIVEVHHGELDLDSVEGVGTTVTIRFPVLSQAASDP